MAKLVVLALVAVVAGVAIWMSCGCCNPPKPPHLDPEEWWGPTDLKGKEDKTVRPFSIKFSEEMIKDLRDRLKNHRPFTPPLEGVGFEYGFNSGQLDSWVSYWAEKYPFAEREKFLNQFPQFKTNIQGLDIHFLRIKPNVPSNVEVLPLLMMHGWPGSVREFYEAIPLLTRHNPGYDFAFELIVPSLPGYGFSESAVRPGLAAPQVAVIMRNLMKRLNFKKFYVQGGDWGAITASAMCTLYPEDILGHHTTMGGVQNGYSSFMTLVGAFFPSLVVEPHLADRMYPLSSIFSFLIEETGYMHLQATKPDTVGVALADSPIGLLAYILEKYSTWTVNEHKSLADGGLISKPKFSKEQLIDNLMMYWTSNSITTSVRLYAETMSSKTRALNMEVIPTNVPTWVVQAKYELMYQPPKFIRTKYTRLVNATPLPDGGHFLAFELPQVFADSVLTAVKAFRELQRNERKTEL